MIDRTTKAFLAAIIIVALLVIGFSVSMLVFGCGCPKISRPNMTHYEIDKSEAVKTPMGATIIPGENYISDETLIEIDDKITQTEECLFKYFPRYKTNNINRSCYIVFIPNDWRVSCEDPEQQVFGKLPFEACKIKGMKPIEDCYCGLRVAVQDGKYIITTPSLYLFRAGVAELITGWSQYEIWKNVHMVECIGF